MPTPEMSLPEAPRPRVLVTGGTGFIGSHTTVLLLAAGYDVLIVDNLSNSTADVVGAIETVAGRRPDFVCGDVRDGALLARLFARSAIAAVFHFAGLKSVAESLVSPLDYYANNVGGVIVLCREMAEAGLHTLVFSSSATVYGDSDTLPLTESSPLDPAQPYGRSKLMIETLLGDLAATDSRWRIASLRYFNPAGAHESGALGERPRGIPNNLMPYLCQVASGERPELIVHGNDYPTPDGTGIRDYIHVMDLAQGHLAALDYLNTHSGFVAINLGTGRGSSVLDLVHAFERVIGRTLPRRIGPRRSGDIAACWAAVDRARELLGWQSERGLDAICRDAWRWTSTGRRPQP